jgi:hypothetical protein
MIMDEIFETARLQMYELDREIEQRQVERLVRSTRSGTNLPARVLAGFGRSLIAVGTALVGRAEDAPRRTIPT